MRFLLLVTSALLLNCASSKESSKTQDQDYQNNYRFSELPTDTTALKELFNTLEVNEQPVLIGGLAGLGVSYPQRARSRGIQGRVMLSFIVNTEGKAESIEVLSGIGHGCDRAAIRAIKRAKFQPGKDSDGNPVASIMSLPINFRLDM